MSDAILVTRGPTLQRRLGGPPNIELRSRPARQALRDPRDWETVRQPDSRSARRTFMPDLLKSVEDGVMKLTFNRPDAMNALSRDMMNAFSQSLEEAAGSRDIGCVVVRGA